MITKTSSILDYSYPFLDPAVWDQDMKLYAYQKDFVLRLLDKMYETYDLKDHEKWVEDVVILGSLTTTKWLLSSDLDVHVRVNLDEFVKTNMPNASKEEAFAKLDETRKEFDRAKILAPMTQHPTEFYIESLELHPSNTEAVGVYSLYQDKWLKEPIALPAELDIEESKRKVVEEAEALAQELDGSLGKVKRDIQRIDELENVIKAWGKDKQKLFYTKIEKKLNDIEEEIKKDIKIKQDLVDYRHSNQDPTSENEILFKYLARNGFFAILQNLKELLESTDGEVTIEELPLIEKVISQANLNKNAYEGGYWIYPDGETVARVGKNTEHSDWLQENEGLDAFSAIDKGFVRVSYDGNLGFYQLRDLKNIPDFLNDFIIKYPSRNLEFADRNGFEIVKLSYEEVTERGVQKAVNRALSNKRLGMSKFASFMKKANPIQEPNESETILLIDFDGTISKEKEFPNMGEPEPGVKEALEKLKDLGYTITIYSSRANTDEGIDQIKEYMEKYSLLYDDIYSGEKPFFHSIIDNRAIRFDGDWNKVIEEVKNTKKASLAIVSYEKKIFQDPTPQQAEDLLQNSKTKMLRWAIGNDGHLYMWDAYDMDHPMARAKLGVDWTLENSGYLGERIPPSWALGQYWKGKNLVTASLSTKYWLDSQGRAYALDSNQTHPSWILDNLDLLKREGIDVEYESTDRISKDMFSKGWARISTDYKGEAQFYIELGTSLNSLPSYVEGFVDRYFDPNADLPIILDSKPTNQSAYISDPFPSLQNAVNKALRQRSMPTRVFSKKEVTAQTKKVKQGDYSCLMALVPHDLAQEIVEWGVRNVPDDKIYLDENGKLGRELESHITIKYGLLTNEAKDLRRSFNDEKPFKAKLGKVKHFQPPELPFDVLTVEVISDDLMKANEKVCENFECAEDLISNDYHPHITIAYMKRDTAKKSIGSDEFEGKELELDTLVFSPHKGNRTYFSISNDKESRYVLEKINKFSYGQNNWAESAWISPTGEVFDLGGDSHEDMIYELINDHKIYDQEDPLGYAINKGWTRFGEMGGGLEAGANIKNIRNIPAAVFDHATKYTGQNKEIVVADLSGNYVHMPVDEFVLGQKAVNKALQQKRMQTANLNKKAIGNISGWLAPDGQFYDVKMSHAFWIFQNQIFLKHNYNFTPVAKTWGEKDRFNSIDDVTRLIQSGWSRIDGYLPNELDLHVADINNIPQTSEQFVWKHKPEIVIVEDLNGNDTSFDKEEYSKGMMKSSSGNNFYPSLVQAPNNKWQFEHGGDDQEIPVDPDPVSDEQTYFAPCTVGKPRNPDMWKQLWHLIKKPFSKKESSSSNLVDLGKLSGTDISIQVPESLLDKYLDSIQTLEKVDYWEKDRDMFHKLDLERSKAHDALLDFIMSSIVGLDNLPVKGLHHLRNLVLSHLDNFVSDVLLKDSSQKESAANIEQEKIEQEELGENETLLEYSKGFKDLNRLDTNKPKTTWPDNSSSQGGEPYAPLPSFHVETNPDNENWRYPWKFTSRPRGEDSDDGKTIEMLQEQEKRKACIERITINITADYTNAYWIDPNGKVYQVRGNEVTTEDMNEEGSSTHTGWIENNLEMLKRDYGIKYPDFERLMDAGWIRVGDAFGTDWGITVKDLNHIPSSVDNLLAQFAPEGAVITVAPPDNYGANYTFEWPVKSVQQTINSIKNRREYYQKQPVHANKKTADLPPQQFIPEHLNAQTAIMTDDGSIYWSDEPRMSHVQFIKELGIPIEHIVSGGRIVDGDYHDLGPRSDTMRYVEQMLAKKRVEEKRKAFSKQAGSYSASVPDYQGEQYYDEQHSDNGGETAYTNWDAIGNGVWDFNQNTNDFPQQKDMQPQTVFLDLLQKPFNRTDPSGIDWYQVQWYISAPMSQGIESVNPD